MPHALSKLFLLFLFGCIFNLIGCEKKPASQADTSQGNDVSAFDIDVKSASNEMWRKINSDVSAATEQILTLQTSIDNLLATPSRESLDAAQVQWRLSERAIFSLTLLMAIIESETTLLELDFDIRFRLSANPIQPGYLDRFGPYPFSGLVYDIGVPLNAGNLVAQHGLTDSEEAVLGIYTIEFMLFGEHGSRAAADYAGHTALSNEHIEQGLQSTKEIPANRRRQLLELQVKQLVQDIEHVNDILDTNSADALPIAWQSLSPQTQLHAVRHSVNAILTQALVDIVQLQTHIVKKTGAELAATPDTPDKFQDAYRVTGRLNSIAAGLSYYSDVERNAIENALNETARTLAPENLAGQTPENNQSALQQVYESLKQLI